MTPWKQASLSLGKAWTLLLALTSCRTATNTGAPSEPARDFLVEPSPTRRTELDAGAQGMSPPCTALPGELVSYRAQVLEYNTGLPPDGLEVRACERAGGSCQALEQRPRLDPDDALELELPRGFAGVLEFRAPALDPTRVWLQHPLCEDEQAALPVWVLSPVLEQDPGPPGAEARPNQLWLQRLDCAGNVRPFPLREVDGLVRASAVVPGPSSGERNFKTISALSLPGQGQGIDVYADAGIDPRLLAGYRAPPDQVPTLFYNLPADQELAVEIFDQLDRYDVLYLRLSAHETAIASAVLSGCQERARDLH